MLGHYHTDFLTSIQFPTEIAFASWTLQYGLLRWTHPRRGGFAAESIKQIKTNHMPEEYLPSSNIPMDSILIFLTNLDVLWLF